MIHLLLDAGADIHAVSQPARLSNRLFLAAMAKREGDLKAANELVAVLSEDDAVGAAANATMAAEAAAATTRAELATATAKLEMLKGEAELAEMEREIAGVAARGEELR